MENNGDLRLVGKRGRAEDGGPTLRRMSKDELKEFVLAFCDGHVYSSNHIEQRHVYRDGTFNQEGWAQDVRICFLPIAMGALDTAVEPPEPPDPLDWDAQEEYEEKLKSIKAINDTYFKAMTSQLGIVWEYNDKSLPRGVNGMPMFMSCRFMHKDDWERVIPAIRAEKERRESIEI